MPKHTRVERFAAWNQLFDSMRQEADSISDEAIYEILYPLPWQRRDLSEQKKQQARQDYHTAVSMNLKIQENLIKQFKAGNEYVLPDLFHSSDNIINIIEEQVLHPRQGELWFSEGPPLQFGKYGVGVNSSVVPNKRIRGGGDRSYDWWRTDVDIPLDFDHDVIYAFYVEDAIKLREQLGGRYDILTITLLGNHIGDFIKYALEYTKKNIA